MLPGISTSFHRVAAALLLAGCLACADGAPPSPDAQPAAPGAGSELTAEEIQQAAAAIQEARLAGWVQDLSTDEMQGRLPGTEGEERATAYVLDAFKAAGL